MALKNSALNIHNLSVALTIVYNRFLVYKFYTFFVKYCVIIPSCKYKISAHYEFKERQKRKRK